MQMKKWIAIGVLSCCSGMGMAQMGNGSAAGAAMGSSMDPAKAEDVMLSAFEGELTAVVKAMPADKFEFAPSSKIFASEDPAKFEGVRTFAQQITHLIQANYYFFGTASGLKPDVDVKAIGTLKTKDELIHALAASFVFAHKAVATLTAANAFETIKGADGMNTRITVASFAVAHGFDHYGQLVEYLRMNGVVPPGSK